MVPPRLEDHTDPGPPLLGCGCWLFAEDPDVSCRRESEPFKDFDGCCLACPVGAEQGDHFSPGHREVDPGENVFVAVTHPQVLHVNDGLARCLSSTVNTHTSMKCSTSAIECVR